MSLDDVELKPRCGMLLVDFALSTVNRQNGIFATPAGSEMNVRITGSIREKNTVTPP